MKKKSILFFLLVFIFNVNTYAGNEWYYNPLRPHFYEISNAEEYGELISAIALDTNSFKGDTVSITANITDPQNIIKSFAGTLMGNNHTVYVNSGLCNELLKDGKIQDININSSNTLGQTDDIGGIVNNCSGTILNCKNYCNLSITTTTKYINMGGICGYLSGTGKVIGCVNLGNIKASVIDKKAVYFARVGGIVGRCLGKVIACDNKGWIYNDAYTSAITGGIVGHLESVAAAVIGCTNYLGVTTNISRTESSSNIYQWTGGIVGRSQSAIIIDRCTNKGRITNNVHLISGIVAEAYGTDITNCQNSGLITSLKNVYYSCAGGICANFSAPDNDYKYLLNCINTKNIQSYTSAPFIATGGGICPVIKYGKIGNYCNTAPVEVEGGTKFSFKDIDYTNSTILNNNTTVSAANSYADIVNEDKSMYPAFHYLQKWVNESNVLNLSSMACTYIEPGAGNFRIYPYGDFDAVKVYKDGENIYDYTVTDKKPSLLNVPLLSPNTLYDIELTKNGNKVYYDTQYTKPLLIYADIDTIKIDGIEMYISLSADGLNINSVGVDISETENGTWKRYYADKSTMKVIIDNLKENTVYYYKAFAIYNNDFEKNNAVAMFNTQNRFPRYETSIAGFSSVKFTLSNEHDLNNFSDNEYGIICGLDTITQNSLKQNDYIYNQVKREYDKVPLKSFIKKNGNIEVYDLNDIIFPDIDIDSPLAISPKAAMVRAKLIYTPNTSTSYNKKPTYKIDLRNFSNLATYQLLDTYSWGDNESYRYATLPLPTSGMYQYRLVCTQAHNTKPSLNINTYTEWKTIDTSKNDCDIVSPLFSDISLSGDNTIVASCYAIPGEEDCNFKFAYKIRNYTDWQFLSISRNDSKCQCEMNFLVDGYVYEGKFVGITSNNSYESQIISFNSKGEFVDPPKSGVCDATIDFNSPYYLKIYTVNGILIYEQAECIDTELQYRNYVPEQGLYIVEKVQNNCREAKVMIIK